MPSIAEYRFYYGVMLSQLCFLLRVPKSKTKKASQELHKAFKAYAGIDSMTKLTVHQTENYFSMIRMLCARERGIFLSEPNEPDDMVDWSMKRFIQYKLYGKEL